MRIEYTPKFKKNLRSFPEETRKTFYKQVNFLLRDIRHPSLKAKKYNEEGNIWQARIDKNIRLYFLIENDTYILLEIKYHPK